MASDYQLNCSLLPHQSEAVDWCAAHEDKCAILAYDMGLGKTVIACALLIEKPVEQTIIMVPTSLLHQWENEIKKHTSGLTINIYHGSNRKYKSAREAAQAANVVLTTPSIIANDIKNGTYLFKRTAKRWIIDEAHKLRNCKSKTYSNLFPYAPFVENKVFLTGTPICNSADDLVALVCLSNLPIYNNPEQWQGICMPAKYRMLEEISDSILLRKTKADTDIKLPPIQTHLLELNLQCDEQKNTYNYFIKEDLVLRKILRMRQSVNNHKQLIEELDELKQDVGEIPQQAVSIKLKTVTDIIEKIPKDDKVIIISYFNKLLLQVKQHLEDSNVFMYHGGLSLAERSDVINSFKSAENRSHNVLLMNLRAGGCGLNLVQANHIILMEPYWNDAEEQQAINRVYRIGQTKPVTVYKLVVKNSIESWLLRLQKSKDNLSAFLLGSNTEGAAISEDIATEQTRTKQFFKFIKELKIDENTEKLFDEYIKTED